MFETIRKVFVFFACIALFLGAVWGIKQVMDGMANFEPPSVEINR